jgi:hypothetical protein
MILKNIINYWNIIQVSLFSIYIYIISKFIVATNIRIKFFLFIINCFILVGLGFYYNLDGLMMLFFVCELTIILVFAILFSQLYSYYKEKHTSKLPLIVLFIAILVININHYSLTLIDIKSFYSYSNILVNDFYYIYNLYFEKEVLLTIFTLFIITLYSLFFIFLYYILQSKAQTTLKVKKKIYLLRKQNLMHQNNYNTKTRLFKNKN